MEKRTYLEACKLNKLRLIECSCKLTNTDFDKAKLEVNFRQEFNFALLPEDRKSDFCLNFNSELRAVGNEDCEYFNLSAKFRADFSVFEKDIYPPDKFEEATNLLGHQLFPVIRSFLVDILVKMGLPPYMPWSVQQPPTTKTKKKVTRAKKGRG